GAAALVRRPRARRRRAVGRARPARAARRAARPGSAAAGGAGVGALGALRRLAAPCHPAVAPGGHLVDQPVERLALLGQLVLDPGRHVADDGAPDDPLGLEVLQPLTERARVDTAERLGELVEAPLPP